MLLQTVMYNLLCKHMVLILLGVYLKVKLLGIS